MVETGAISNELKKLLRHSSHYLAGLLGAMALGFVSFPIFTRVFSVADYGTIDFVQKILLVLIAVSKMGTQNSALRFYDPRVLRVFLPTCNEWQNAEIFEDVEAFVVEGAGGEPVRFTRAAAMRGPC